MCNSSLPFLPSRSHSIPDNNPLLTLLTRHVDSQQAIVHSYKVMRKAVEPFTMRNHFHNLPSPVDHRQPVVLTVPHYQVAYIICYYPCRSRVQLVKTKVCDEDHPLVVGEEPGLREHSPVMKSLNYIQLNLAQNFVVDSAPNAWLRLGALPDQFLDYNFLVFIFSYSGISSFPPVLLTH